MLKLRLELKKYYKASIVSILCILLQSCATFHIQNPPKINNQSRIAILTFINNSQTPQADEVVRSILFSILHNQGFKTLSVFQNATEKNPFVIPSGKEQLEASVLWAKEGNFDYWVTGTVDEWRYLAGLNGEPAVGITLKIYESKTEQIIWSATGARTGWGRESATMSTSKVLSKMLKNFKPNPNFVDSNKNNGTKDISQNIQEG